MTKSERRSVRQSILNLIDEIWRQLGQCGNQEDVKAHLRGLLTAEQRAYIEQPGLTSVIGAHFRKREESGLPQAPEVDKHGTHRQLELLDVGEWRYVIRKYMQSAAQNTAQAYSAARKCLECHGVWIDPETVLEETAA